MAEGPNDWERQVGPASHERNAAENPVPAGPESKERGEAPSGNRRRAEPLVAKGAPKARLQRYI